MTAWEAVITEQIDAKHRESVTEWHHDPEPSGETPEKNAAFLACRTAFSPPRSALRTIPHPKGVEVEDWRDWMRDRYRQKMASGHYSDRRNAVADVWSEAERAYHFIKGKVPFKDMCAGCGCDLVQSEAVMNFADGARTHLMQECIDRYDPIWREAANAGLVAMGLKPSK